MPIGMMWGVLHGEFFAVVVEQRICNRLESGVNAPSETSVRRKDYVTALVRARSAAHRWLAC
jgi:hypothetical protein